MPAQRGSSPSSPRAQPRSRSGRRACTCSSCPPSFDAFFSAVRPDLHVRWRPAPFFPGEVRQKIGNPSPGQKRGGSSETVDGMTTTANGGLDTLVLGRRIRHLRTGRNMTLDDLGAAVGRAPSQVSMIENGHREPKLSLLAQVAGALGVPLAELLRTEPPTPTRRPGGRARARAAGPALRVAGLPPVKVGRSLPADALEALVRPAAEIAAAAHRARRDPGGGPPGQRRAADADARAGQLLPRARAARAGRCSPRSTTPAARCRSAAPRTSPPTSASPCTT